MPEQHWISPAVRRPPRRKGFPATSVLVEILIEGAEHPRTETRGAYWYNRRDWATDIGHYADNMIVGWRPVQS